MFVLLVVFFYNNETFAQGCAMCKVAVESNLDQGKGVGSGLNQGILFLMAIPYLSILLFTLFWYFQNKKVKE